MAEENPYQSPQMAEHQLRRTPNKPSYVMGMGCFGAIVASVATAIAASSPWPLRGLGAVALIAWISFYLVRTKSRSAVSVAGQDSVARTATERILVVLAFMLSMGIAFFTTCTASFLPLVNRPDVSTLTASMPLIAAGVAAGATLLWLVVQKDKVE